jgi:hypothetical protein
MNRRTLLAMVWGVGGIALFASTPSAERLARAGAPAGPRVELSVIHASSSDAGGSVDPRLRDLPQLTRDQPFVRYNVYRLLDRTELPLERGKPSPYALVNGRTLQVTLTDVTQDKGEKRYHVRVEIGEPGKQAFLKLLEVTASANDPFFVAGQSYQGGTLFLELVMRG